MEQNCLLLQPGAFAFSRSGPPHRVVNGSDNCRNAGADRGLAPVEAASVSFPVLCTVPVSGSGDVSSSGSSGIGRDAARRKAIQKRAEIQNHSDSTISMAF